MIANSPQVGNLLFARSLLEELRVFGAHERLEDRIAHYLGLKQAKIPGLCG